MTTRKKAMTDQKHREKQECLRRIVMEMCAFEELKRREEEKERQKENEQKEEKLSNSIQMQHDKPKYDFYKWKYSELRETIYTSCNMDLVEACRHEFYRRLKVYHTWKRKHSRNATMMDQVRAPQSIMNAVKASSLPQKSEIRNGRHRYFCIPYVLSEEGEIEERGWWYAHFDGQYVARQIHLYPDKTTVLLQAGVDDLNMCELTLEETGLTHINAAEIVDQEFERQWSKHGGALFLPYDVRPR